MQTETELTNTEQEETWEAISCLKEAMEWIVTDIEEKGFDLPHKANIKYFLKETDKLLEGHI